MKEQKVEKKANCYFESETVTLGASIHLVTEQFFKKNKTMKR